MSRTNIDLDDELTAEVMRRFSVAMREAAVDLALRRLVGAPLSREFLLGLEGIGWDGDLDVLRSERPTHRGRQTRVAPNDPAGDHEEWSATSTSGPTPNSTTSWDPSRAA